MKKEIGKKLYSGTHNGTKILIETIDGNNPVTLSIQLTSWITPIVEMESYDGLTKRNNKAIRQYLYDSLNSSYFNNTKYIVTQDTAPEYYSLNKPSYLSFELTLAQNHPLRPYNDESLLNELKHISKEVIQLLIDREELIFKESKKEILKIISTLNI